MFSQFLSDLNPTWLIVAGIFLFSFAIKNTIIQLIQTLNLPKVFLVGFCVALTLCVLLTSSGAIALESVANNSEIQKPEIGFVKDKITEQSLSNKLESSLGSMTSSINTDEKNTKLDPLAIISSQNLENSISSKQNSQSSEAFSQTKTKKIQEKTTLQKEIKLTVPDVSDKFGEVKIDILKGTEVSTAVKETLFKNNLVNATPKKLAFANSFNQTASEAEIVELDQSTIQADQTPRVTSDNLSFEFGNPQEHLIFSKPVKIETVVESSNKEFVVQVTHKGDIKPSANGLSLNPETCQSNDAESLIVPVVDAKITFYTCGASTFSISASAGTMTFTSPISGSNNSTIPTFTGTGSVAGATITLSLQPAGTVIGTSNVTIDNK